MSDLTVWVGTEPDLLGAGYVATVSYGEDRSRRMTPAEALTYASTVLAIAARADFDASVHRQMTDVASGVGPISAAFMVRDLRNDRPEIDQTPIAPMTLEPGVTRYGKPFLTVAIDGTKVGQWSPEDAREHAGFVLEVCHQADLDAAYYRLLVGQVGVAPDRARMIVEDVGNYSTRR